MHTRRLTAAEQARILEFREKWIRIGLSTTPLDHQRAGRALRRLYAASGLARPSIVWAPCPMTALLSAIVYTRIRNTRQEKRAGNDGTLARIIDRSTRDALNRTVPASAHRPMQLAVERAVAAALGRPSRIWSGLDVASAIAKTRRAGIDRVVNGSLGAAAQARLHTRLLKPMRAGLSILSELLEPALNRVAYGIAWPKSRRAGLAYAGAPLWAPYAAERDYAGQVLGLPLERSLIEAVESAGLFWALDGICFAAERPTHLNRDEAGHLHCEVGPSVSYPSGWSWWHWHGIGVPQHVIEMPERITPDAIHRADHPELSRIMIERYRWGDRVHGIMAYLRDTGARLLDRDPRFGTLWHLATAEAMPTLMVEVANRSPEPDGAYRHFLLRVDPELRPIYEDDSFGPPQPPTARNAVASTFGLSGAEYMPEVET